MSEFKGTKGEWYYEESYDERYGPDIYIINTHMDNDVVEFATVWPGFDKQEAEANAKLISCAPDMLKELKYILDNSTMRVTDKYRLESLIKKATS